MKTLKNYIMKITHIKNGHSFELNETEAADFFFRNDHNDYEIEEISKISDIRHYLTCIALFILMVASGLLHIHWNY